MRKKYLYLRYGQGTVEDLALAMHDAFHGRKSPFDQRRGWTPYKKCKTDPVVATARAHALIAAYDQYEYMAATGFGSANYSDEDIGAWEDYISDADA